MGKNLKTYLNTLNPATKSFINTRRLEAAARIADRPLTGADRSAGEKWLQYLNDVFKRDRTTPPPLIAINAKTGKPMTLDEIAKTKENAKANALTNAEDIFYIAANSQGIQKLKAQGYSQEEIRKYSVRWDKLSAQSSQIFGRSKTSALDKELKTTKPENVIETYSKPDREKNPVAWAQSIARAFVEENEVGLLTNSPPEKFGIVVMDGTGFEELYIIKVKGPKVQGETGAAVPFYRSKDYDNFTYATEPIKGPFNNVIPEKASRQASAIAHWRTAEATKKIEDVIKFYEVGLQAIIDLQELEEDSTVLNEYAEAEKATRKELNALYDLLKDSERASSVIADFTVDPRSLTVKDPTFIDAKSKVQVTGNSVTIPVINNQKTKISLRQVVITNTFAVDLLSDRDIAVFFDSSAHFNSGIQQSAEDINLRRAVALVNTAGSYSPIKYLTLQGLAEILEDPELAKAAISKKSKPKQGREKIQIGKKGKKVKEIKKKPPRAKNDSKFKNAMPMLSKRTKRGRLVKMQTMFSDSATANKSELLGIINANLRRAVIGNMRYPALINRTGRFASSVEALDIVNNIVKTRYQYRPYMVFEQRRGKAPWNDRIERDPVNIINNAIRDIGRNRLANVALQAEVM